MLNVYMNTILFFGTLGDIGSSSQELFVFQGDFIKKYFLPCIGTFCFSSCEAAFSASKRLLLNLRYKISTDFLLKVQILGMNTDAR